MEYISQRFITLFDTMTSLVTVAALMVMPFHTLGHDLVFKSPHVPIKACGSALADYVADVCDGVYNLAHNNNNKRGEIRLQNDNSIEPEYYYNDEMFIDTDSSYPFRSKRSVSSMIHPAFRSKREVSIVHECCIKACTHDELLGYCG